MNRPARARTPSSLIRIATAVVAVASAVGSLASAQDEQAVPGPLTSPAALLEALRAAGVEVPEGWVVNDDGSVSPPDPAAAAGAAESVEDGAADAAASVGADAGAGDAAPGAAGVEDVAPVPEPKAAWDNKIDVSLSITDGNSENAAFRIGYLGERTGRRELSLLKLDSAYTYASSDGVDEVNRATFGVNHDWLFKESRWIAFAGGRLDYDQFRSFRWRAQANAGGGYKLVDREDVYLTARFGGGLTREFGSDNDDIIPEALLGADFGWQIAENQSFDATLRYFPALSDTGEFRAVATADWRLDLDQVNDGLGLVAGVVFEHVSEVDEGTDQNDVFLFGGLTWDF